MHLIHLYMLAYSICYLYQKLGLGKVYISNVKLVRVKTKNIKKMFLLPWIK